MTQTMLSLLGADEADAGEDVITNGGSPDIEANSTSVPPRRRIRRYFRPLWRSTYYKSLIHLLVINFFYGLVAFVYLFVGTLVSRELQDK